MPRELDADMYRRPPRPRKDISKNHHDRDTVDTRELALSCRSVTGRQYEEITRYIYPRVQKQILESQRYKTESRKAMAREWLTSRTIGADAKRASRTRIPKTAKDDKRTYIEGPTLASSSLSVTAHNKRSAGSLGR